MDNDLIQDTNLDLLQVNAVEVEYSGIAPINVDNQEHTISLDPSALSSKLDTSAFDEWTATHDVEEYSAGEGIDITDHVISVTGQLTGDYLTKASADTLYQPIGDYLSATDSALFYPMEGNPSGFLTGVDLSNYYEKNETSSKEEIENAITSVENTINNLSGEYYPLTSNPSGYLTAHQSLDDYQKTADMTAYQTVGDYYSASNPSGFITGVDLSNYYEKNETCSKEEINTTINNLSGEYYPLDNPSGFITGVDLSDYQLTADMTGYQEKGDYYSASNPSGFITGVDLTPYQEKTGMTAYQPVGDYYSASNPSGFITGVDLTDYYKKNETSSKEEISAALTSKLDESAFTAYTATAQGTEYSAGDNIDITNHVVSGKDWTSTIESAVSSKLDTTAFNSGDFYPMTGNPSGFLTGHQSLTNYYQKNETSSKEEISAALSGLTGDTIDLSAGAGISIIETANKVVISCTATGTEFDPTYMSAQIDNKLDKSESANYYPMTGNPSGFLTAHQSLSNYYRKNETSSKQEISAALADAGHEYSGIAPIGVNNTSYQISAETWSLSAGDGLRITEDAIQKVATIEITGGGEGAGFPITGMDGSTVYSADCNGSSFNIRSQYSTTYFAPRSMYHAHSPAYGASADYSNIIDVANTFCTAIPCVTVANSGLATANGILYIVTGA